MFVLVLIMDLLKSLGMWYNQYSNTECWLQKKVINVFFLLHTLKRVWVFLILRLLCLRCKPETKLLVNLICTSVGIKKEDQ